MEVLAVHLCGMKRTNWLFNDKNYYFSLLYSDFHAKIVFDLVNFGELTKSNTILSQSITTDLPFFTILPF